MESEKSDVDAGRAGTAKIETRTHRATLGGYAVQRVHRSPAKNPGAGWSVEGIHLKFKSGATERRKELTNERHGNPERQFRGECAGGTAGCAARRRRAGCHAGKKLRTCRN